MPIIGVANGQKDNLFCFYCKKFSSEMYLSCTSMVCAAKCKISAVLMVSVCWDEEEEGEEGVLVYLVFLPVANAV